MILLADIRSIRRAGTPEGTRTPGLLLRRQLLYPTELLAHSDKLERVTGIEPASPAWKAGALAIVLHPHGPSAEIVSFVILAHHRPICQGENRKNPLFPSFRLSRPPAKEGRCV